jgi:PAS domain S-box-containing protein
MERRSKLDQDKTKEQLIDELLDLRQRLAEATPARGAGEEPAQSWAEASPVGVFRTDARGDYVYVNERWCEVAGLAPEEAYGDGWARGLHPDDREPVREEWYRAATENLPFELEYRFLRPDGVTTWVLGQAVAQRGESGQVEGYVGTITDVTVRRRIEEVLERSEARFYSLVEQAGAGIVTTDVEGRFMFVNRTFFQMIGYPSAELLGQPLIQFLHPDDVERIQTQYQEGFQRLPERHLEYRLLHKDGHIIHCYSNPAAIFHQGQVIGTSAIIHDITERKRAEEELRRHRDHLEEMVVERTDELAQANERLHRVNDQLTREVAERKRAEETLRELNATLEARVRARTAELQAEYARLDAILRSVGDGILMADQDMRVRYVNPAFVALTGYTETEVLGKHAGSVLAGASPEQVQRAIQWALVDGRMWQGEVMGQRKDGRTYDAALIVAPVRDAEDRLIGYVSSHRDISPSKDLERARNQFITNVSHEFRTPVTVLSLAMNLLQGAELTERERQYLEMVDDQIARLTNLIVDTLEITTLDTGNALSEWRPVSVPGVMGNAIERHRMEAERTGLILEAIPPPPDLPVVNGDHARLIQALGEIVENGVVFTPIGGRVTVEAEAVETEDGSWVTITVRDTGPGISLEEQGRVFDRFFRGYLAESGHIPGTGLGLSIAQEIARAHGGQVTVESEPGAGSAFTIWLPVAEQDKAL